MQLYRRMPRRGLIVVLWAGACMLVVAYGVRQFISPGGSSGTGLAQNSRRLIGEGTGSSNLAARQASTIAHEEVGSKDANYLPILGLGALVSAAYLSLTAAQNSEQVATQQAAPAASSISSLRVALTSVAKEDFPDVLPNDNDQHVRTPRVSMMTMTALQKIKKTLHKDAWFENAVDRVRRAQSEASRDLDGMVRERTRPSWRVQSTADKKSVALATGALAASAAAAVAQLDPRFRPKDSDWNNPLVGIPASLEVAVAELAGGAITKQLDSLTVGEKYESKDEVGNWWLVETVAENPNGTYQCKAVCDSRAWNNVHPQNCRPFMEEKTLHGTSWLVA